MHYIKDFREGEMISDIYLCKTKQALKTKAGKIRSLRNGLPRVPLRVISTAAAIAFTDFTLTRFLPKER